MLDSAFKVPGTSIRFGWDPILGLVPGLGDAVTTLFGCLIILQAIQMRIPRVIQLRMALNVLIDAVLGVVPFVGDLFDFAWRANDRNFRLLERHAYEAAKPSAGDWVFVLAILGLLLACTLTPIVLLAWLLGALGRSWL